MANSGIRFRIGVTGHRDVDSSEYEAVTRAAENAFSQIKGLLPNTPISLITGMADGADRILAQVALKFGFEVEAVLPMPMEYYRKDFEPESLAELEAVLEESAVSCLALPLADDLNTDESSWSPADRDSLYANLSDYLRRHANLLVAVWDGEFNQLPGGTGDTVLRSLEIGEEISDPQWRHGKSGQLGGRPIVCWIPTRRVANESKDLQQGKASGDVCWISTNGLKLECWDLLPDDFMDELQYFDQFNGQYNQLSDAGEMESYGDLLGGCEEELGSDASMFVDANRAYLMADSLALYHQKRSDRLFALFSLMAAAMGLLFLVYAKLAAVQLLLIGYLVLFFGGVLMLKRSTKREWFSRHLVYRCLAENLRVRFYLDLVSEGDGVNIQGLLRSAGISSLPGFSWIRHVLVSSRPAFMLVGNFGGDSSDRIDLVKKHWIDDQGAYFNRKYHAMHHKHHQLESIKTIIVSGLVIAAVILIFFKKALVGMEFTANLSLKTLLIFFMGLFPFWLGVWEIYQGKMAVKELMWQYRNQGKRFERAAKDIGDSDSAEYDRKVILDLGMTSILENSQWIIHRYHREHEPPTAG